MSDRQVKQQFLLGDSVTITSILSIPTADTARISIKDPSLSPKITNVDMTKSADKVYTYIYQSGATDVEGDYIATITVTFSGKTAVYQTKFTLVLQE